jgi:AraC-like DNA-binding protein
MSFHLAEPSSILAGFVKQYWAMESDLPDGHIYRHRIIPSGLIDLTFYFGDRPKSLAPDKCLTENSLITGQQRGYYELEISGSLSMFSVSLKPYGAMVLFDIPVSELSDHNIPLKYLIKDNIERIESSLQELKTMEARVNLIEEFLINQLRRNYQKYDLLRIKDSIQRIDRAKGIISIDKLASQACLSRKQYERIFIKNIGITPKQFLKTVRFQHALWQKQQQSDINLGDLSFECGYYDQPHMNLEFKSLAGMTPKQFFAECEPFSDYFSSV